MVALGHATVTCDCHIQLSGIMAWFNMTWYCMQFSNDKGRTGISLELLQHHTCTMHPISALWVSHFQENLGCCHETPQLSSNTTSVNSSCLINTNMCLQTRPSLVQIMACCWFSARPGSETMLEYYWRDRLEQVSVNFVWSKHNKTVEWKGKVLSGDLRHHAAHVSTL